MKNFIVWWKDNFTRKTTWTGILVLIFVYYLKENPEIFNHFINKIIDDSRFIDLFLGVISGSLIIHKFPKNEKDKENN